MNRPERKRRETASDPQGARSSSRSQLQYAFTVELLLFARHYRWMVDDRMRPRGYSSARMEALAAISQFPEATAQGELARRIGIEAPTFTRMLDLIEQEGLVVRTLDPSDRRSKLVQLTKAGWKALREMMEIAGSIRDRVLIDLSDDELRSTNELLRRLMHKVME